MFLLGLLIGAFVYFIALLLWGKTQNIGLTIFLILLTIIIIISLDNQIGVGVAVCVVVLFIVGLVIGKKQEESRCRKMNDRTSHFKIDYKNHCWNCGCKIDSDKDLLCPHCGKHYICPNCGKCWCDDPRNW